MNNIINKIIHLILCNVFLLARLLFLAKIKYNVINLVSPLSNLLTRGNSKIVLGKKCVIRKYTELTTNNGAIITIGEDVFINRNCILVAHKSISIGAGTTIGPNVMIYDHDHDGSGGFISSSIVIGKNVWIGAGVIILRGCSIGDNCIVAAGSIVTKNIKSNTKFYQKRINIDFSI